MRAELTGKFVMLGASKSAPLGLAMVRRALRLLIALQICIPDSEARLTISLVVAILGARRLPTQIEGSSIILTELNAIIETFKA